LILIFGTRYHRPRLFRTNEKNLGLGPRSLQVGDEVWILGGGLRFLVILRPPLQTGGAYRFMGTAYVHGVMHGEAAESDVGFEEIELQ
jgi:hypothetical protein